jgi:NAD(P)-dependent dehydrogenase (short-subunit alcohol dehydrogenase family)
MGYVEGEVTSKLFAGKVALVTGGSSGIGAATADALARAGAAVIIASRGAERGEAAARGLRTHGVEAEYIHADVSRASDVAALFARAVERFGRLDCAVNAAAAIDDAMFKKTAEFTEEEFDGHIRSTLKSVWLCMKHEIAVMLARGAGAIVNVSSVNGLGGAPSSASYAAAKAAVIALSKSAALEYAAQGIRINALVPGAFRTPMLESVFARMSPGDPGAAERRYDSRIPFGRIGSPGEAARAAVWLCSDEASYVTGHSMIVDGGLTAAFR